MKLFKKLSVLFTCLIVITSSACSTSQTSYKLFGGSYWLSDSTVGGVAPVYEKCTYAVEATGSTNNSISLYITESNFYTILETTDYNGTACYKFSTNLTIKGRYQYNDQTIEVNDYQRSECYFLGLTDKLTPLYSTKTVSSVTPTEGTTVTFTKIEYTSQCVYDREKDTISVTVTAGEANDKNYDYLAYERTFDGYTSYTFIDNECMLFFPRACKFEEGFSQSFYTLDVLAQKILPMNISVSTSQPTKEVSLSEYVVDGRPLATENNLIKFDVCYNALIQINSEFSGQALEYSYTTTDNDNRNRLITFKQQLPASLGSLSFKLKAINNVAA